MLSNLKRYVPLGTSFNDVVLPRIVDSLSDGDAKYSSRLPKLLRMAQKKVYGGSEGVVNGT